MCRVDQKSVLTTEDLKAQQCTFHPNINQNYQHIPSNYGAIHYPAYLVESTENLANFVPLKDHLKMQLEEKARRRREMMEQERRNKEYEMLKDCTFKPKINEGVLGNDKVVIVKGIGRHMELQDLKRKQEEEKLMREYEVFGFAEKYDERVMRMRENS